MEAGARPRHILTPASKIARSSLKTPILIRASLIESSLLPFSHEPLMRDGTYWLARNCLNFATSVADQAGYEKRMISAARGQTSAHQAACTGPFSSLWPPVRVVAHAFRILTAFSA